MTATKEPTAYQLSLAARYIRLESGIYADVMRERRCAKCQEWVTEFTFDHGTLGKPLCRSRDRLARERVRVYVHDKPWLPWGWELASPAQRQEALSLEKAP